MFKCTTKLKRHEGKSHSGVTDMLWAFFKQGANIQQQAKPDYFSYHEKEIQNLENQNRPLVQRSSLKTSLCSWEKNHKAIQILGLKTQ